MLLRPRGRNKVDVEVNPLQPRLRPVSEVQVVRREEDLRVRGLLAPVGLPMRLDDIFESLRSRRGHVIEHEREAGAESLHAPDVPFREPR